MTLCPYFMSMFPRPFSVRNVTKKWDHLSVAMDLAVFEVKITKLF